MVWSAPSKDPKTRCNKDGAHHDKFMLNNLVIVEYIPIDIPIQLDLGFKGLEEEYKNIEIPHSKPRGG